MKNKTKNIKVTSGKNRVNVGGYFEIRLDDKVMYTKQFENATEARHWIINHLDVSKNWSINRATERYIIARSNYGHQHQYVTDSKPEEQLVTLNHDLEQAQVFYNKAEAEYCYNQFKIWGVKGLNIIKLPN